MAETLQALAQTLAIPGLPDWVGLVLLVALGLVALTFLAMPFSVFGVKARLEQIEAQLDEIHAELRGLALRQADGAPRRRRAAEDEDDWVAPPAVVARQAPEPPSPRPIPPPPAWAQDLRPRRVEPRLDQPPEDKR